MNGKPLHIVFAGTPEFAVPSLRALAADPAFQIDLIITQPDKPVGRTKTLTSPPVKMAADRLRIPVWQPEKINVSNHESRPPAGRAGITNHDFLVVVAYGQIFSRKILALPRIAAVNLHASLLPRWRGASPLQHAILAGDTETGVTVQRMVEALDAGPVFAQERTAIADRETLQTLQDRLSGIGAELLVRTLRNLPEPTPQSQSGITVCKKLTRTNGSVDAQTMTASEIDRRVRALVPWPGVRMTIGTDEVKLLETDLAQRKDALPVPCTSGTTLYVLRLQKAGGTPVSGAEWKRGHQ